ncbi:hypothetical protein PCCS19_09950 [Paenibacillus sp. CCS19]|uniref:Z-ring formation inhibitor MciZ n=1 Tax=Paenibacillus sp. CCS19 TaxID=3158387 RepID=UPI002568510A|nr:Z-ring formation inhibitor MciZ [Paenibacillus cellulosilyticus]GMK37941.1 hypothetical protein PCCS19_09950 [Paenibacillus cellulosilyticus]
MKAYYAQETLRLVGKGWEIRRQLKEMSARSRESVNAPSMLADYLYRRSPKR